MRKYICGVPLSKCQGSNAQIGPSGMGYRKVHSSTRECFMCWVQYYEGLGYKRVGSREFETPNGGPIVFISKQSKCGTPMRMGKAGDDKQGKRLTPMKKGQCSVFVGA